MKKKRCALICLIVCVFYLTGCSKWVVRTSSWRKPRVDQELSGNRGFIQGEAVSAPQEPRFKKRRVYHIEVEIPDVAAKKETTAAAGPEKDQEIWGNQGYIYSAQPRATKKEPIEPSKARTFMSIFQPRVEEHKGPGPKPEQTRSIAKPETTYKVRKGDTLQKISQKFYGTTKKWPQLYKANQDRLKGPNRLFPGQVLVIPQAEGFRK